MKQKGLSVLGGCLAVVTLLLALFALAGCSDGAAGKYDGKYYLYENGACNMDEYIQISGSTWSTGVTAGDATAFGSMSGKCEIKDGKITLSFTVDADDEIGALYIANGMAKDGDSVELFSGTVSEGKITLVGDYGATAVFYRDGVVPSGNEASKDAASLDASNSGETYPIRDLDSYSENYAYVQLDVRNFGRIVLELDPSAAPVTVANFTDLVGSGFYDGLTFHRIISGFMIQGGDPKGNGTGGSPVKIKGEFSANGWENPIKHTRGVISMARSKDPDSASSQFFIVHKTSPHLDGQYAAFGRVVDGMDVVDAIAAVRTDASDFPLESVVIERAVLLQNAK